MMETRLSFENGSTDMPHAPGNLRFIRNTTSLSLIRVLVVWALLGIVLPQNAVAQSLSSIKTAEKAVEKAKEKVKTAEQKESEAQKAADDAKQAVDEEREKMKKEAEKDPKAHGTQKELQRLKGELDKAEEDLAKKQAELEKAKEKLKKEEEKLKKKKEEFEEKQRKALEKTLKEKPLPDDKKGLEDYKKEMEKWKNGIWGTDEGEDLKERLRKKIEEKLRELEHRTTVPDNGMRGASADDRFLVALTGSLPLSNSAPKDIDMVDLSDAIYNTSTFEQLYKRLGGEFFVGESTDTEIELQARTDVIPGIAIAMNFNSVFEIGISGGYFRSTWTGEFPVTVVPVEATQRWRTEYGVIKTSASGMLADINARFLFPNNTLRPYVEAGAHAQLVTTNSSEMTLAGVSLPFDMQSAGNAFSLHAGAGARINLGRRAFLQAGATIAKWPAGNYGLGGGIGIGLRL